MFFLFLEVRLYCYKLPSQNCFCCIPQVLGHCAFVFICLQIGFCFLFDFFSDFLVTQKCIIQHPCICVCVCMLFPLQLITNLTVFWLEKVLDIFPFKKIYQALICDPRYNLSGRLFHVNLRKKYIPQLDVLSQRYQLGAFSLMSFKACISLLIPIWMICSLV